ncbi:MAG TPA: hypothetical protein VGR61_09140, partial [Candidatus Dormibacteraeota bacterium]|nr:hypothetical protein [Candidatus Dormibacteraeota bacterium]
MRRRAGSRGWAGALLTLAALSPALAVPVAPRGAAAAQSVSILGYGGGDVAHCGTAEYCWVKSSVTVS